MTLVCVAVRVYSDTIIAVTMTLGLVIARVNTQTTQDAMTVTVMPTMKSVWRKCSLARLKMLKF